MAVRRTLLVLGDLTAAGQVPINGLTALIPSGGAIQGDFRIWNTQTQMWENLTPGVNSNPTTIGTTFWGVESLARQRMIGQYPTGTLYCIKHAASGDWSVGSANYAAALAQVTAAAAAANLAGDTLSIDGLILSVQTAPFRGTAWRGYGALVQQLIASLRTALLVVPHCTTGTFRNDGVGLPTVVVEPHYGYTGLTTVESGQLLLCRSQAQALENRDNGVFVARTEGLTAHTDGSTFSALGLINLAGRTIDALFSTPINDAAFSPARLVLLVGDDALEGSDSNGELPDHLQQTLFEVALWQPQSGSFQPLSTNVCQISIASGSSHGPELILADRLRAHGPAWFVKATQVESVAGNSVGLTPVATPPHHTRSQFSWAVGRELPQLALRGWFVSAIHALRTAYRPELDLLVVSAGKNDLDRAGRAEAAVLSVELLVEEVLRIAAELQVSTAELQVVLLVPAAVSEDARLGALRQGLFETANRRQWKAIDLEPGMTATDLGLAIYEVWQDAKPSTTLPLFAPSLDYLRSVLRLSKLSPDNDAVDMIDHAILSARSRFFGELGQQRIDALLASSFTRSPKTQGEYLRAVACDAEIMMVRASLIQSMPLVFMDGSSPVQMWQEEGAFREGSFLQTREVLRHLNSEIEHKLGILRRAELTIDKNTISVIGTETNPMPGDSVFRVI